MKGAKWTDLNEEILANQKADVYSLGFTLIELLTREKLTDQVPTKPREQDGKIKFHPDPNQIIPGSQFYQKELDALIGSAIPEPVAKLLLQAIGPLKDRPTAGKLQDEFYDARMNMTVEQNAAFGEYNKFVALDDSGF